MRSFRHHLRFRSPAVAAALCAALAVAGCGSGSGGADAAAGDDTCADLAGKNITLVVPYSPGGGYDSYARLVAPALGAEVGAQVVVENQPGAGGLLALNNLRTAKRDGTTIAIMNGIGAGGASLAGAEGASFALTDFSYLGRLAGDAQMIVAKGGGPVRTFDDVRASQGFRFGSTGPGASDFVTPSLLISVFGLRGAELITGFEGSSEVELALLQGNVDGMSGQLDSRQAALTSGDQTPLLTFDRDRAAIAPDTPTVLELTNVDDRQRSLLEAHLTLLEIGRPLVGPPGMDEGALGCLRGALAAAVEDPGLLSEAEKQERPLNYLSGPDLEAAIAKLLASPEEYKTVLRDSFA